MIHDRNNQFYEIRKGLQNIAGRNFWPNSTVQLALPDILKNTPMEYFLDNSRRVYVNLILFFIENNQQLFFYSNMLYQLLRF